MWLLSIISNILWLLYKTFRSLADASRDIPIIGGWCADQFEDIAWWFNDLQFEVVMLGRWFEEVQISLWDILNWPTIYDKIKSAFFDWKSPWDWFFDTFWNVVDSYFPWLRTTLFDSWWDFIAKLDITLPSWGDFVEDARTWLTQRLYDILPWGDLPDLTMAEEARIWVQNLIPEITIPEIPTFERIMEWVKERFPVIKDLDFDPIGWLTEKMADALGAFLGIAAWPFLHTVEGFLERLWDEESEEGV
ncbi:MAG: hypothetical protein GH156_00535 [Dehalococcoidia bacterium]|nr:hypothetical protein [Dehalococcoidia bacterium]